MRLLRIATGVVVLSVAVLLGLVQLWLVAGPFIRKFLNTVVAIWTGDDESFGVAYRPT